MPNLKLNIGNGSGSPKLANLKGKIVVVDDYPGVAQSLAVRLRVQGYEVDTALDGASAIELIGEMKPDLALIDLGLPIVDGCEVARHVRKSKDGDKVLLIAISGWLDDLAISLAMKSGFDVAIGKPIDDVSMNGILNRLAIRIQHDRGSPQ